MLVVRTIKSFLVAVSLAFAIPLSAGASDTKADKAYSAVQVKEDFDELYQRLKVAHYDLYVNKTQAEYDQLFKKLKSRIKDSMTESEIRLLFQEFVSFGEIAHARIDLPADDYREYRKQGGRSFPLYIKVIDGKVFVAENYSDHPDVSVGMELLAINGEPVDQLFKRLRRFKSADNDYIFNGFLELELPLYLWFEFGPQATFNVTLRKGQKVVEAEIKAVTHQELLTRIEAQEGLLQLSWERNFEVVKGIGYLRPGPFFNFSADADNVWDNSEFSKFIEEAFAHFREKDVDALLIDIRNNPGGDNSFSDLMVKQFADKPFKFASEFNVKLSEEFIAANEERMDHRQENDSGTSVSQQYQDAYQGLKPGDIFELEFPLVKPVRNPFDKPVYVLINRHSYSNAVTVAAQVQDYGFATIIGEKTSDLATTYGAMENFKLTHTDINVGFPKAHIIRPSGDRKSDGVTPDIVIKTPLVETDSDPVLQEAFAIVRSRLN
ncbi:MAG: hypothetical protein HUJ16_07350 [Kangiella sp.]|nr:hypothetical protein [Kangiella sp.]